MGDRVLIVMTDGEKIAPVAIYSHWCGNDAPEMIVAAGDAGIIRKDDLAYATARMCGYFHSDNPESTTGLGLIEPPADLKPATLEEYSHGDAGVILVDVGIGNISYPCGYHAKRSDAPKEINLST